MYTINILWFLTAPLTIITAYYLCAYMVEKFDHKLQDMPSSVSENKNEKD